MIGRRRYPVRMDDIRAALESHIALVPDFPEPGILFRDLTPVFTRAELFRGMVDAMVEPFAGRYDAFAGIEARGFLLAGAASMRTDAGVLAVRKAGKLPRATLAESYALEYGEARLEVHADELDPGARVLVLDDVLATGGTAAATCALVERAGWEVAGVAVVLELEALGGRSALGGRDVFSLLQA